ncbi:MAG: glycoside hydrolase family 95 protein, partial [Clostridia bacterium]|nr:glycoside hydrolase family 95 protein [Clostridia bacterium]
MKKRVISFFCMLAVLLSCISGAVPFISIASDYDADSVVINGSELPLRLWYDEEAPELNENAANPDFDKLEDDGWQQWSLPIGNGYFGASVFGRTETERVQITEKTLSNKYQKINGSAKSYGGLNNFSETYIDFGHTNSEVTDYMRDIDMSTAISSVKYTYGGVKYTREYFTSYPDKALVIRIKADTAGALSFTLRPTVPYEQEYMAIEGDGMGKSGEVTSSVIDDATFGKVGYIELSGKLDYYDVDFLGIYKVYTDGGTVAASTTQNKYGDTDGTITVDSANTALIVVTLGTDYELSSEMFTAADEDKPTFETTLEDTRRKVEGDMAAIDGKLEGKTVEQAYDMLKRAHVEDHSELFGRVTVELGCDPSDFELTTDELLAEYQNGYKSTYLETLLFQYGRYQLIASSREGALPANLQGVWNPYNTAPWGSGYWHNINIQMNYWPAFSTNLAETFKPYVDFNDAFMKKAEANATNNVDKYNQQMLGQDGGNGWVIGVGSFPYSIASDRSAGNLGFTTQMFWEYYQYTQDEKVLNEIVLPKLLSAARYITKCVELDENGNYLVSHCDSPEVHVNGVWYYTKGTTYAQTFAYLNNYHTLRLAEEAGIDLTDEAVLSTDEYSVLKTVMEQINKYDPINVGLSGQIKEFREEDYYSSVGDDPNHRHVSQLVGLYPGNVINSNTPAWIDAALVTLEGRGQNTTGGWVYSHKAGLYARAKEGDEARARVDELLSRVTFPNLFTRLWEVYQIDASCGITAGIAEMLLQSNAGYIEPLAALPTNWSNGSYTGLCAEGNFEVSAAWEGGLAKTFNILSKSGGVASVAYSGIGNAKVVRVSDGSTVDFTVDGANRISFNTAIGESYIISGFTAEERIDAPTSLRIERADVFGEFTLEWADVTNAESYNVYMALENSPTYTLIGNTQKTAFNFSHTEENENKRTTFAITAVNTHETESKRVLCYSNPIDTSAQIYDSKAYIMQSGEVQVVIQANENAAKYRLYSQNTDDSYTLLAESATPVLRATGYDKNLKYYITAVASYDGSECEKVEVSDFASYETDYDATNVFEGKSFVQNDTSNKAKPITGYEYSKLTDGIIDTVVVKNGRYSSTKSTEANPTCADAVIDLGDEYFLNELTFYVYNRTIKQIGTNFTVEVYSGGEWVAIVEGLKNTADLTYTAGSPSLSDYLVIEGDGKDNHRLVFNLNGIRGSKIRFYADVIVDDFITFYEAECSGVLVEDVFECEDNILNQKSFLQIESAASGKDTAPANGYGYEKMTDGILDRATPSKGRYSSKKGGAVYAITDLDGIYVLDEIKFYYFDKRFDHAAGTNYTVEAYYNGEWEVVVEGVSAAELKESHNNSTDGYIFFDLNGIKAEKIRFYAEASSSTEYVSYYEVICSGYCIGELVEEDGNLFIGKEFESSLPTISATISGVPYTFSYPNLTDGKNYVNGTAANMHEGRFSTKTGGSAEGILDLGNIYAIDEIRFYPFSKDIVNMGTNFTLEVLSDGIWKPIVSGIDNSAISTYKHDSGNYVSFKLNGIRAEKVRFSADANSGKCVTLYEIECFGSRLVNTTYENASANALSGITATANGAASATNANDGMLDTYVSGTGTDGTYSVEFSFDTTKVFTLGIYEIIDAANLVEGVLSSASDKTKVEIYRDGMWLTVYNDVALDNDGYTEFDLYGTVCERIRVTFKNNRKFDGESTYRCAKISEITCTPGKPNAVDRTPLIEAYDRLVQLDIASEAHKAKMAEFRERLVNFRLSESDIIPYETEMNAYYEMLSDSVISYIPKSSITLGSELVYNIYVPVTDELKSFTVNGNTYEGLVPVTLDDGKS